MTSKEKAKDLVEKYANVNGVYGASKRCALIAVDEILEDDMNDMSEDKFNKRIEFWQQVKTEIELL